MHTRRHSICWVGRCRETTYSLHWERTEYSIEESTEVSSAERLKSNCWEKINDDDSHQQRIHIITRVGDSGEQANSVLRPKVSVLIVLSWTIHIRDHLIKLVKRKTMQMRRNSSRIVHIGEHIQDIGFLPLIGGLTPCIQEVDLLPRIRIPSEVLGKLEEGDWVEYYASL